MKTFILEWHPALSTMTEEDYLAAMLCIEWGDYRRGFKEKPAARSGDNFYLMRTSTDSDGLIAKGFFITDPYEVIDKKYAFRMNLRPTFMVSWENPKGILSLESLKESINDFPWGASGECREITARDAERLSSLWNEYITRFTEEDFDEGITVERLTRPAAEIDDAILLASEILYDMKSPEDGRPIILQTLREGLSLSSDDEVVGHILKDVCTFSGWTLGMLRDKGFSEATVDNLRP